MTRNQGNLIDPNSNPESLIRRNHRQQQPIQNPRPPIDEKIHEGPPLDLVDDNIQDDILQLQLPANESMARNEQTLREYALPYMDLVRGSNPRPTIAANNFEIKPTMIQMIQNNQQFRDTDDAIHLRLFPFPLTNNAFSWLDAQAPSSTITWHELAGKYFQKFFPISETIQLSREISMFRQLKGERFHETWERFKNLLQNTTVYLGSYNC